MSALAIFHGDGKYYSSAVQQAQSVFFFYFGKFSQEQVPRTPDNPFGG
jgi:hypothetical protein